MRQSGSEGLFSRPVCEWILTNPEFVPCLTVSSTEWLPALDSTWEGRSGDSHSQSCGSIQTHRVSGTEALRGGGGGTPPPLLALLQEAELFSWPCGGWRGRGECQPPPYPQLRFPLGDRLCRQQQSPLATAPHTTMPASSLGHVSLSLLKSPVISPGPWSQLRN